MDPIMIQRMIRRKNSPWNFKMTKIRHKKYVYKNLEKSPTIPILCSLFGLLGISPECESHLDADTHGFPRVS